jgi:hypothetical protein
VASYMWSSRSPTVYAEMSTAILEGWLIFLVVFLKRT